MLGFFIKLTSLIVALVVGGGAYVATTANAEQSTTAADLAQVAQTQVALSTDGTYSEQITSLEDSICAEDLAETFGDICTDGSGFTVTPLEGDLTISYAVNTDRTHFVVAGQLDSDQILVLSDAVSEPVACEGYTTECIALVTDDPELIASVPIWQTI